MYTYSNITLVFGYLNCGNELLGLSVHGEDLFYSSLEDVIHLHGVQGRLLVVLLQNICTGSLLQSCEEKQLIKSYL
jgi:hypothetical protein